MKQIQILFSVFLLCLSFVLFAQERTIIGKITDTNNESIIGVNIVLQGTTTGTVSDVDGNYKLQVPGGNAVLIISFIGFETQTIQVGSRSTIDVKLEESETFLEEVVISALGFRQNKDQMGATYSTVNTADMVRSGETTLLNSLGAKASNVQISKVNGDPGAGTTIRIRGANTISGSSSPLIILDGIPISNSTIYGGGNNISGGKNRRRCATVKVK